MKLSFAEKKAALDEVWEELVEYMKDFNYTEMGSCNKDYSRYLVVKGTENQVTYHGKPQYSFRISDHWNWRNERKAPGEVQCALYNVRKPEIGEKPLTRIEIGLYKGDVYHFVCGERKQKNGGWIWDVPSLFEIYDRVDKYLDPVL